MPASASSQRTSGTARGERQRGLVLHVFRVALFATIVLLIRREHQWYQAQRAGDDAVAVSLERIRRFYPDAALLSDWDPSRGGRVVVDGAGSPLGQLVQTSPISDRVVGYSGPTNTLIAFDKDARVLGLEILSSGDTPEHVRDVLDNDDFMTTLDGATWDEATALRNVDAVSGATLTSLAIAEGISYRLGGARPSLLFPDDLTVEEIAPFRPGAIALRANPKRPYLVDVLDDVDTLLGSAFRTSPAADDEVGYQGPTDTLIVLDGKDTVVGLKIRRSYDNEPYVRWVGEDAPFAARFVGLDLHEFAELDLEEAEIEGVSGATMTSMAIARALPRAAGSSLERRRSIGRTLVVSTRDLGTIAILVFALVMSFTRLRGRRTVRITFQILLVGYLGFLNGDMLSQALLAGWAQSGVPWRLAPGLVLLTAAAILVPVLSKRQLYCHQVCPFGAAQELVRKRLPWRARLPRRLSRTLKALPAALLLLVVATAVLHLQVNLAAIEPFNAFLVGIAGAATISIAVAGLLASTVVPMAYCRYGCPTGMLLGFLRYGAGSARLTVRDALAVGLLALAIAAPWLRA